MYTKEILITKLSKIIKLTKENPGTTANQREYAKVTIARAEEAIRRLEAGFDNDSVWKFFQG